MPQDQVSATGLTKDFAYRLVDLVMDRDDLALTASAHEDEETDQWTFEATCESPANLSGFQSLTQDAPAFSVTGLDETTDWVTRSLEGLKPVTAGGFYVYGSHETAPLPHGLIPIKIDAAQAFGTGHHETTTGCLEAITRVLKYKKPFNAIDLGTGTGILAIAVAKRLKQPVIATDIDPVAVKTTLENARINGVSPLIVEIEAAGLAHPAISGNAPYDLIIANILAGPLVALSTGIGRIAQKGATIILSGLLTTQAQKVAAAYNRQGMVLKARIVRKDWATLILEKA